jgi:glycine/D-amino acid oxidase-like deaminating enzyme/nitrite reductase/ring-hydroxylating ferredoxin subunit
MPYPSNSTDGLTRPIWFDASERPTFEPLATNTSADVCVIGAGISGLTSAYLLLCEGKSVVVLDDSAIGDGQTGRTSAHLTYAMDDRFYDLERMHGEAGARACRESHSAAIDEIERISRAESIDCDFARIDGYLFNDGKHDPAEITQEFEAARRAGADVELVDRVPVSSFDSRRALRFRSQARFHPLKYLDGLARAIVRLGGRIYTQTHVNDALGGDPKQNQRCATTASSSFLVESDAIIVATNTPAPINDWAGIYTKQASYRTYMLGFAIGEGSVPDALYWDTGEVAKRRRLEPYHYVRVHRESNREILLVGGADQKVGHAQGTPYEDLEAWTRARFPNVGEIVSRWSGQVQEPVDGVAYIGRAPTKGESVFVITGDSGQGLTHGTLGAMLCRDLILGRSNPWESLYDPSRKPKHAFGEFAIENAQNAATYAEYLTPGEANVADIRPGEGAIVRKGIHKLAVYRDESGNVSATTAVCNHLGCIVHWNAIEKSWDCPCHGSRFDCKGKVVMGPAIKDLEPFKEPLK